MLLFVSSSVSRTPLGAILAEIAPFLIALIATLFVLTYIPWLSLALPAFLNH